jgi:hypothetical protein
VGVGGLMKREIGKQASARGYDKKGQEPMCALVRGKG